MSKAKMHTLSLVLAFLMLFSLMPTSVLAADGDNTESQRTTDEEEDTSLFSNDQIKDHLDEDEQLLMDYEDAGDTLNSDPLTISANAEPRIIEIDSDDFDWSEAQFWGRSTILTGKNLWLNMTNSGDLMDMYFRAIDKTATKGYFGAYGAAAYYGDTSGVKVVNTNTSNWSGQLLPIKLDAGEEFVWSTDITINDYYNDSRWISLTLGNEIVSGSATVDGENVNYETYGSRIHLQFKVNGSAAGVAEHDGASYYNFTSNNAPYEAYSTIEKGSTHTLTVTGGYTTINGEKTYVLNLYMDNCQLIKDWAVVGSHAYSSSASRTLTLEDMAGYIGIEASGVSYEINYDDTIKTQTDTSEYSNYTLDETYDYSNVMLHEDGKIYEGNTASSASYKLGNTGIQVSADGASNAGILLPITSTEDESFVFSADITITASNNTTRWLGLSFGGVIVTDEDGNKTLDYTYHANMRLSGNDAALCHVDAGHTNGAWGNLILYPRVNCPLEVGKTYNWKIVVTDGHILDFYITDLESGTTTAIIRDLDIEDWIGNAICHSDTMADNFAGYLGIDCAGMTFEINYAVPEGQYKQELYTANENIVTEAVVAWESNGTDLADVLAADATPSHITLNIDENMAVSTADGTAYNGTLVDACTAIYAANAIPLIHVDDQAEAEALAKYLTAENLEDVVVITSDISVLEYLLANTTGPRGIYDLSASDKDYTEAELEALRVAVNSANAKIILLSEASATYESVKWLEAHLMVVWAKSTGSTLSNYTLLTNGVDGILAEDYADVYSDMSIFTGTNVLLRVPTISGHRGSTRGYEDTDGYYNDEEYVIIQENTVEALVEAAKNGAEAVEYDVYLTADNVMVMHHNASTSGIMVDADGNATSYNIPSTNYYGVLDQLKYIKDGSKMDTLEELFQEWSTNPYTQDTIMYLEIKPISNGREEDTVLAIKALVEKYDLADQILVITFSTAAMAEMREHYAGTSLGYLITAMPTSMSTLINSSGLYNSTWNVSYSNATTKTVSNATIRSLYARGTGTHGWTIDGVNLDEQLVSGRFLSLTSNQTWKIPAWANHIELDSDKITVQVGETVDFGAVVINWLGEEMEGAVLDVVNVSGEALTKNDDGTYTMTSGDHVVMLSYTATTDQGVTYTLYSNPLTITQCLWGDANGDGIVNAKDARLVLQYYNEQIDSTKLNLSVCDVNGDGQVNAKDARLILQYYNEQIDAFPVEG